MIRCMVFRRVHSRRGAGFDVKSPRENTIIRSTMNILKNRSLFQALPTFRVPRACQGRLLFPDPVLASLSDGDLTMEYFHCTKGGHVSVAGRGVC